jgi:hypothetical protein
MHPGASIVSANTQIRLGTAFVVGQDGILRGDWQSPLFGYRHSLRQAGPRGAPNRPQVANLRPTKAMNLKTAVDEYLNRSTSLAPNYCAESSSHQMGKVRIS